MQKSFYYVYNLKIKIKNIKIKLIFSVNVFEKKNKDFKKLNKKCAASSKTIHFYGP